MEFLYLSARRLLENICAECHSSRVRWGNLGSRSIAFDLAQIAFRKSADGAAATTRRNRSIQMLDVLMIALTASFFALAIGYAYACERL
jgi:hypothetical protein